MKPLLILFLLLFSMSISVLSQIDSLAYLEASKRLEALQTLLAQKEEAFAKQYPECANGLFMGPAQIAHCKQKRREALEEDVEWQDALRELRKGMQAGSTDLERQRREEIIFHPQARKNLALIKAFDYVFFRLDSTLQTLEKMAGKDPQTGEIKNKSLLKPNWDYFMGTSPSANNGNGNGQGRMIQIEINEYLAFLDTYASQNLSAQSYEELSSELDKRLLPEMIEPHGKGEKMSWVGYTFSGPIIANMAMLEALKVDVQEALKRILDELEQE